MQKDLGEILLPDVHHAMEVIGNFELFNVHAEPDTNCPIGKNMGAVLRSEMRAAQAAALAGLGDEVRSEPDDPFGKIVFRISGRWLRHGDEKAPIGERHQV